MDNFHLPAAFEEYSDARKAGFLKDADSMFRADKIMIWKAKKHGFPLEIQEKRLKFP